jgi:hypothetical protein
MQVDESSDITSLSVSLVCVRYIYSNQLEEEMLMCLLLLQEKIYPLLTGLYVAEEGINWNQYLYLHRW